jgi:hypothetical protein
LVSEVARELGISETTYHRWRNRYGRMNPGKTKRLKELEMENARLKRVLVDLARTTMESNKGTERKYLARAWELRGLMRCSCGSTMGTHTTQPRGGRVYHYYKCKRRSRLGKTGSCRQKALRPAEVQPAVWHFVSELLTDPEKIKTGMERLIDDEVGIGRGDPEREAETWAEKLEECARLRRAYQQQQAAGLMTLEELGRMLKDLEETHKLAEAELAIAAVRRDQMETLERDRDELLGYMSAAVPEGLESLTGEERNRLYRMLRLQVTPSSEGYELKGVFCTTSLPPRSPRGPRELGDTGGDLDPLGLEAIEGLFQAPLGLEGNDGPPSPWAPEGSRPFRPSVRPFASTSAHSPSTFVIRSPRVSL